MENINDFTDFNSAERLQNLMQRAGYKSQQEFARACRYNNQSSIARYLKRDNYQNTHFSMKVVSRFVIGLAGRGDPEISEAEVWDLAAPEDRPPSVERQEHVSFRMAFSHAKDAFEDLARLGVLPTTESEIAILSTAFARVLSKRNGDGDSHLVIEEAVKTIAGIREVTNT